MKITEKQIDELAYLARLEFKDDSKDAIKADLDRIIEFCEQLREVDTSNVEPLVYMSDRMNNLREDEVIETISHEEALKNAPDADSDYFKVPKFIRK